MSEPPATARRLKEYVDTHSLEIHGAIIFDLFVANNDRAFSPKRRNLALDADGRLFLYDHGNACFYRPRPTAGIEAGAPRLTAVGKDIAALFDMDHKQNTYREFLTDWDAVRTWCDKIKTLPDYFIDSVVDRIPQELDRPNESERRALVDFLKARRATLFDQIEKSRNLFPDLPNRKGRRR